MLSWPGTRSAWLSLVEKKEPVHLVWDQPFFPVTPSDSGLLWSLEIKVHFARAYLCRRFYSNTSFVGLQV